MATPQHKFQPPKGMRDFYPADMAVRRYIEGVWREVSINHGFEEIEGPMFEHTDLYTHKSGPGIVSELFQVFSGKDEAEIEQIRGGKDAPYALRPEFTPTLARMVAARAAQLSKPIKWFAIPAHFRAERPQRGRLREFMQWNVDVVGHPDPNIGDVEIIAVAIEALRALGLDESTLMVSISNRDTICSALYRLGVPEERTDAMLVLLDRRNRISGSEFEREFLKLVPLKEPYEDLLRWTKEFVLAPDADWFASLSRFDEPKSGAWKVDDVKDNLRARGLLDWCTLDLFGVVRGLAYYTGTVFEIIAEGERAVAGGGRYDKLIESFGGPSMPACGFGMGDVVLSLLLHEKGLLPEDVYMRDLRPHVFVIAAKDEVAGELPKLVAELRRDGYHVRHTYRSTRNVGKLLGEAGKCGARTAIILDDKLAEGIVSIKDLASQEQRDDVTRDEVESTLRDILAQQHNARV